MERIIGKEASLLLREGLALYLIGWRFTGRPRARLNNLNIDLVLLLDIICMVLLLIINVRSMHNRVYSLQLLQRRDAWRARIFLLSLEDSKEHLCWNFESNFKPIPACAAADAAQEA